MSKYHNQRVKELFEDHGLECQLMGNMSNPVICIDQGLILHATIDPENDFIVFWKDQEEVGRLGLLGEEIHDVDPIDLIKIVKRCDKSFGFRLRFNGSSLFVSGWDSQYYCGSKFAIKGTKYPLFSHFYPMVFTQEVAGKMREKMYQKEYISIDKYQLNPMFK